MSLINVKVHLEMTWIEKFVLSSAGESATFKITDTKLYAPIVTLSTEDNVKLTKSNRFKCSVYWNEYKTMPAKVINNKTNIYELLSASFQGIRRLFVLAYDSKGTDYDDAGIKNNRKYFLPRAEIKNYNVLIDGRNFYDQPINDLIKQYDEVRKVVIGQGDNYTTRCLQDYAYFKDNFKVIAFDISKQRALDADPKAIQKIVFQRVAGVKLRPYTILEKSREAVLEFSERTANVL